MKHFNPDRPLVVGLAGKAGTGKTSTADALAPQAKISFRTEPIVWSHLYFALPLYELASIRQSTEGQAARDRMKYQIHERLLKLLGGSPLYGAPPYHKLVSMVEEIATYPCAYDGKPRKFLQHVGTDILRAYDDEIWVKWVRRKVQEEYVRFQDEYLGDIDEEDERMDEPEPFFGVILSDVRFPNEAAYIKNEENGILIKLTATDEVLAQRQTSRDGTTIDDEHRAHSSEVSLDEFGDDYYDLIIDTSDITLEEQVQKIKDAVQAHIGVRVNA